AAPEIEMLQGARREVLALRDVREADAPLDQHAGNAAQAEIDREAHAHGAAADDDDLIPLCHNDPRSRALHRALPSRHYSANRVWEDRVRQKFALLALIVGIPAIGLPGAANADKASGPWRLAPNQPVQSVSYYYDPTPETVFESEAVYDSLVSYDVGKGAI